MKSIIGLDISITSPGVCILSPGSMVLYSYTDHMTKKQDFVLESIGNTMVIAKKQKIPEGCDGFERIMYIVDRVIRDIQIDADGAKFFFEGYAMGAKGRIFDIAEITSLFKARVYQLGHRVDGIYAPMTVKKEIWGKGNMNKEEIFEKAKDNETLGPVLRHLETKGLTLKNAKWIMDMVDAWSVAQVGIKETTKED